MIARANSSMDPPNSSDIKSSIQLAAILERANAQDHDAQVFLYERYSHRLVRLASSRIATIFNSKIEPEDVVQSVFRTFFIRNRSGKVQIDNWNDLWSFLTCVTIRKCNLRIKEMMRLKRNVNREFSMHSEDENDKKFDPVSDEPTAYEVAVFEETLERIFSGLSDTQCEIVRLRMQGYSNEEISVKLHRTERTVYRALSLLREQVQQLEASLGPLQRIDSDELVD